MLSPSSSSSYFYLMPLLCSRIPPRAPHYIQSAYVPKPLLAVTVPYFSWLWWTWQVWGVWVRHFVDCAYLRFVCYSFMMTLGFWVRETNTKEVKCHSHDTGSRARAFQHDLPLLTLASIPWPRSCSSGFPMKATLYVPPFYTVLSGRELLFTGHTKGKVRPHHLGDRVLAEIICNSSVWGSCLVSSFICLLNHLFI